MTGGPFCNKQPANIIHPNPVTQRIMAKKTDYHSLDRKKGLYLKNTRAKGRGVFCRTAIRTGEEIEANPTLVLNEAETKHLQKTILRDYMFTLGKISKRTRERVRIKEVDDACCLIMGVATYCNHDETPNARLLWEERDGTLYHVLEATRNIPKDTEICTSYGEGWFDGRKHMSN